MSETTAESEEKNISRWDVSGHITQVASMSLSSKDTLWVVRHYNGAGSAIPYIEVHAHRCGKILGFFEVELTPTLNAKFTAVPGDHTMMVSEKDMVRMRKARLSMLNLLSKFWE
jgi:hypothetical protein